MVAPVLYGPPPQTLAILLSDPDEHDFPAVKRILADLSPEQAVMRPHGLPYSIAQIVAHMHSNMQFNLALIDAADPSTYRNPHDNWPTVTSAGWPNLVEALLNDLAALERIAKSDADLERVVYPGSEDQPAWTVGYKLAASVAKHNAYHFGQIVVLRRLIGAWS